MAKSMTLLWGAGSPPCWRVMIALEEKKLHGYKRKLLSFERGEHKSQEVLEINPRGQNQFKSQGHKLIPDSPAEQALMYQRMMEGLTLTEKLNSVVYYEWIVPEEERHDSAVTRHREALTAELKLWEGYLQRVAAGSYLAGAFSLADVIVFPNTAYAFRFGLSVGRYPKLAKYYSLLKDRPSIKTSWPPHWVAIPQGYDILKDL
ncbi:glutathione S-transferase A-like isoform X2 [Hippoglossus hippoglossus]|uniref:glutathione S-transferase A-like isoform X2 n=1 Tax=Hippoglossus hippoglossus TaxID=8267 RepID=UPI00148B8BDF|nr:glutathione S-transferase A-like isoform X2 [Hippoglossus hippoglossus]